jgi:hypothetical protein
MSAKEPDDVARPGDHGRSGGADRGIAWGGERGDRRLDDPGHPALPADAAHGTLGAVSCPSKASCTAVGTYADAGRGARQLAEHWNGSSWAIIPGGRRPARATGIRLTAISCTSAASCTAVGSYDNAAKTHVPLAEHWNGTSWAIRATAGPAGVTGSALSAVSCASDTSCMAAGVAYSSDGTQQPLAEHWDGISWTIQATPSPASQDGSAFTAVSCASVASCTAVGYYFPGEQAAPLAEYWDGSSWTIQAIPSPSDEPGFPTAVSCASPDSCTAAGYYYDDASNLLALAEHWDGSSWTIQAVSSSPARYLYGISCPTPASCTAVRASAQGAYAEHWNGSTWRAQQTAQPTTNESLAAISCATSATCTAVGETTTPSHPTDNQPLAEHR